MARTAEGWRLVWNRGVAHVRFRLQGKRYQVSTRERDPLKASTVAAQIYTDIVSGSVRRSSSGALVHPGTEIDELCADWIADIMPELGEETDTTYEVYARHWATHFRTIGNVRPAGIGEYQRQRLRSVQRSTLIKERGALRRFLTWCVEKELMTDVPDFPPLPKKSGGKKHKQGRSVPLEQLSVEEVERILALLPEFTPRSYKGRRFPVRAYYRVCYETGLRPEGTVNRLLGKDLTLAGLHIRPECDKNRWERVVPLSPAARKAFESLGPLDPNKPIFGTHDLRVTFRKAAEEALDEVRGKRVTPYDLKHARVTAWVDAGKSATGIKFLTGTDAAIDRYTHPNRRAAEEVIGFHMGAGPTLSGCEGRDLNSDGSYPASTSSKSVCTFRGETSSIVTDDQPESTALTSLLGAGHPKACWPVGGALIARCA